MRHILEARKAQRALVEHILRLLARKYPEQKEDYEQHRRDHSQDNGDIDHRPGKAAKPEDGSNGGNDEAQESKFDHVRKLGGRRGYVQQLRRWMRL